MVRLAGARNAATFAHRFPPRKPATELAADAKAETGLRHDVASGRGDALGLVMVAVHVRPDSGSPSDVLGGNGFYSARRIDYGDCSGHYGGVAVGTCAA